ncbi:unnamed protein product, partial [Didymodactylos carnosus]
MNKYDIDIVIANQAEMELFLEDISHLLVFNQIVNYNWEKLLRRKSLERFLKRTQQNKTNIILIQNQISPKRSTLLDFHSNDTAEQMTLLDSELFLKISIPEILYMSIAKGEDYCPNLSYFTEHVNKMSYWVRLRILEQDSQRQRKITLKSFSKF